MAARRIGVEERRARLAGRHHLVAGSGARSPVEDRELVRILGMRRTMFVVPLDLAAIVQAACTRAIAIRDRRRTIQILTQCGIADDPGAWFADLEEATVRVLATHGEGTAYAASQSVVTRVLMQLAADGRVIRGRPRGSWTSSQYRWAPIEAWLPEGVDDLPTDTARVELVRRWLTAFGPGTPADVKWWTGWTAGEVKRAVEKLGAVEVELDGATGLLLPDDLEPVPAAEPWVALLPALDPTVMGWAGREWYLGEHGRALIDRNGNAGPTIWCDGRIVGGWAHRRNGEVAYRLLEDIGADAAGAVATAAECLRAWIGDVRVTPRFRTPLERQLSA